MDFADIDSFTDEEVLELYNDGLTEYIAGSWFLKCEDYAYGCSWMGYAHAACGYGGECSYGVVQYCGTGGRSDCWTSSCMSRKCICRKHREYCR